MFGVIYNTFRRGQESALWALPHAAVATRSPDVMYLLFAGLVGVTFFALLVWAGTMVYRLYHPERARPFDEHPVVQREKATARGEQVSVGVREIRADQRRERRKGEPHPDYVWGRSDGIPEAWREDLWQRRN